MTSFTPWLKPTLLGPLLTSWGMVTLGSLTLGLAAISGGRIDGWLIGMLWASAFGCMLGVATITVDVLLLRAKVRALPQSGRAWISSLLSPIGVLILWQLPIFPPPETILGLVLFLIAPMFVSPLILRTVFGVRP